MLAWMRIILWNEICKCHIWNASKYWIHLPLHPKCDPRKSCPCVNISQALNKYQWLTTYSTACLRSPGKCRSIVLGKCCWMSPGCKRRRTVRHGNLIWPKTASVTRIEDDSPWCTDNELWEGNGSQGPEDIKFYLFKQPLHKFIELLTGKWEVANGSKKGQMKATEGEKTRCKTLVLFLAGRYL